jgi:hypothetical protein
VLAVTREGTGRQGKASDDGGGTLIKRSSWGDRGGGARRRGAPRGRRRGVSAPRCHMGEERGGSLVG